MYIVHIILAMVQWIHTHVQVILIIIVFTEVNTFRGLVRIAKKNIRWACKDAQVFRLERITSYCVLQ